LGLSLLQRATFGLAAAILRVGTAAFNESLFDFGSELAGLDFHFGEPSKECVKFLWSQVRHWRRGYTTSAPRKARPFGVTAII
jgi:hypothetical protein